MEKNQIIGENLKQTRREKPVRRKARKVNSSHKIITSDDLTLDGWLDIDVVDWEKHDRALKEKGNA